MKSMFKFVCAMALVALLATGAGAQSLGEAARQARKSKRPASPAKKVFTNENIPKNTVISADDAEAKSDADTPAAADDASGAEAAPAPAALSPEEKLKLETEFRGKVAEAKGEISRLERELSVAEREDKLRNAVFYADAGTRLRDEAAFAEQQRTAQAEMETKRTELETARQKLEELRDQIRAAGLPSAVGE